MNFGADRLTQFMREHKSRLVLAIEVPTFSWRALWPFAPLTKIAMAAPGAAQNLMQDFSQLGVTPSIPAVGQSPVTGLVSNMASRFPFSSPVIRQGVGQTIGDTANAVERVAGAYGSAANPEEAGNALQNALSLYTRQTFPQQAGNLYSTFDNLMQGVGQVPLTNTMKTLGAPMARSRTWRGAYQPEAAIPFRYADQERRDIDLS
jgi:hypothetical protein